MDEELVSELEGAIADTGALLVRVQKYRRGTEPDGVALAREALGLGDSARRLHRQGTLDAAAARRLLGEARALGARLYALLVAVHDAPGYRSAVAAHAAGDHPTVARLLPAIFAGLEPVATPGDLFAPLTWLRRGRLRPVEDLVAEVVVARLEGLAAEGDDLSPGADAQLPAVVLTADPPSEPVALRLPAGSVSPPVHRLLDTGEHLVHVPRLRTPAVVVLLTRHLELEEQLRVEIAPAEWADYRTALAAALAAATVPVEER